MSKKKYYEKNQDEHAQAGEMEETEERGGTSNVKIEVVLLAVIAVALVIQTFYMISGSGGSDTPAYVPAGNNSPAAMSQPQSQPQIQSQPQAQPQQMSPQQQIQQQMQQQTNTQQPSAAQPSADANATTASYSETTHDFGVVGADASNLSHTFTVTNDGAQPLAYTNVRGDAGLTVTSYPTSPIPPGGSGQISVTFDPAQSKGTGNQAYNVHLDANTSPGHQHLVIQATVN